MPNDMTPFAGDDKITMSSREISDLTGKDHDNVRRDIKNLAEALSLSFEEKVEASTGGRPSKVFLLGKRETMILVSGYSVELRAKIIDRLDELEAERSNPAARLDDNAWLRHTLLGYTEKVTELQGQIAEVQPKLQALERIADSDGSFCITVAAKNLQARPKDLFAFLRGRKWIYSRGGGSEVAYQDKLQAGLLEHKTTTVHRTDGSEKTVTQVRVTPKGLTVLAQQFGAH